MKPKTSQTNKTSSNISRPFEEVISEAFGKYAKYIIQERALPDVRDGLKPVQRRILYTAYDSNLLWKNPHKKSAKLVGEVMGKYHPHGDSSIYEAIVRMAQPWKTNLPLLNMHGNSGSIDGDPAAAMRYTEVRLSKVSELMLGNLDKKTVPFMNNFDDTETEPIVLPALFFNLLVNGATGIAAGYATNIPPFNPGELISTLIKILDNPKLTPEQILLTLPAPDLPTFGSIEVTEGILEAYKTGKGKFFIYANFSILEEKKIDQIIFSDIPFETNKATIIKQIDELIVKNNLPNVLEVRDESDRKGISIVLDIEKNAATQTIINYLYKNTDLRVSYNINFVVIDERKPKLMSMPELLLAFLKHMKNVVYKGFEFDAKKLQERLEILDGLIKALSILDEIITLIRRSQDRNDAKNKLIRNYDFTNNQAEAIINLRLYRLTSSDIQELTAEKAIINQKLTELKILLTDEKVFKTHLKTLMNQFSKEFSYPRKTKLIQEEIKLDLNLNDLIISKNLYYCFTKQANFKLLDVKKMDLNDLKNNRLKQGDLWSEIGPINLKDNILFFTSQGNLIITPVHKLEIKKMNMNGSLIHDLLKLDPYDDVIGFHRLDYSLSNQEQTVLLTTKKGLTKHLNLNEIRKLKELKTIIAIKLNENDQLVSSLWIEHSNTSLLFLTKNNQYNHVLASSINCLSRNSSGQKAMKINDDDEIIQVLNVPKNPDAFLVIFYEGGYKKIKMNQQLKLLKLAQAGKKIADKKASLVTNAFFATNKDFYWTLNENQEAVLTAIKNLKTSELDQKITNHVLTALTAKETLFAEKLVYDKHEADLEVEGWIK